MPQAAKLDSRDFQILYELDQNSRQHASRIARKVRLSVDSVNYRLRSMISAGAIFKFITILDTAKLGLTTYKMLLRLQNTTQAIEEEMLEYFLRHDHVQLLSTCEGNFDINVNVLAFTIEDLQGFLDGMNRKYGKYIADREIMAMVQSHFFFHDYFVDEKKRAHYRRKPIYFGSTPVIAKIDGTDKRILGELSTDARLPTLEIARRVGLSADSVALRIKKLERACVIQNYMLAPNLEKTGFFWYYVLVKFAPSPDFKGFFSFCEGHPNIWYFGRLMGRWDAIAGMDVRSPEEFKEILMLIKRDFSGSIREYTILRLPRFCKWTMYPGLADKKP